MTVIIRQFSGLQDYLSTWQAMQRFTNERTVDTQDEIWLLQHPPVFTQGQNGKEHHLLATGNIPVIQVDRGGQVTYHGPGQLVVYTLVDVKRKQFTVRDMVTALEQSIIDLLAEYDIVAATQCKAPGVYVNSQKICSMGLRIRKGCAYHGLALNVDMDLEPFSRINPCGFSALKMTQLSDFITSIDWSIVESKLIAHLINRLGYTSSNFQAE